MSSSAATWPIDQFFAPEKTASLYEAINQRQSCRRFLSAPSTAQWSAVEQAAAELTPPGARIALGLCETSLFQPFFGLLMKFENVRRYAAVITTDAQPQSLLSAGVAGEMLLLRAVSLGLAGVWVSGTYRRDALKLALAPGEKVVALIALGVPPAPPCQRVARKRKPLSALCETDFAAMPLVFREIAVAVQAAPSALNAQPWRMRCGPEGTLLLSVQSPKRLLDLGIAVAHAVLALGRTDAFFTLSSDGATVGVSLKP